MTSDDDDALKARRDKLAAQLKAHAPRPEAKDPLSLGNSAAASAWSLGVKAGSEFIAAVIVGGGIGWGLDYALHTKPAFTIVFFLLGVVSGIWNVIRATTPKGGA